MTLSSLWQDRHPRPPLSGDVDIELVDGDRFDVAVVGAGLTGLTTALLLARAGRSVVVLEAGRIGAGTTARSTAKVSCLQGTRLSSISAKHPEAVVTQYVEAQRTGFAWLQEFCLAHDVPAQQRDAVTYAHRSGAELLLHQELDVARSAGLPVTWDADLALPFHTRGGVRLADQLQVDPLMLLDTLASEAAALGVRIVEHARVTGVSGSEPVQVASSAGQVAAGSVVVATNLPVLDRGGFFARMEPARSYCVAFRTPSPGVDAMYLAADAPSRSVRDVPAPDGAGSLLLIGGNGHKVGADVDTAARVDELRRWTHEWWPDAEETHAWSAQDYLPHHGLPFAGPLVPGRDHLLMAGGYSKWGFTNAVAAAHVLTARLTGADAPPWAGSFATWSRRELSGLATAARMTGAVGVEATRGWVGALASRSVHEDGVSRVCTHLGGITRWNEAERSWDCPLHGSRFDQDGEVLEGPATCGLQHAGGRAARAARAAQEAQAAQASSR